MKMTRIFMVAALAAGATVAMQAQEGVQGNFTFRGDLGGYFYSLRGPLESTVVAGMPYSAEITSESIQTLSDGNRIVHRTTGRVYRDGQGRVRREDDQPSGTPTISIVDPVSNTSITIDAAAKTARETSGLRLFGRYEMGLQNFMGNYWTSYTLTPFTRAQTEAGRGGRGAGAQGGTDTTVAGAKGGRGAGRLNLPNQVEEQLANRTIEGVPATGVRRTTTIEKGAVGNEQPIKVVSEEWTSTDLKVLVLTDFNDPRTGRSTYKLTKINRAEPDPALFKAPAGYTVERAAGRGGRGRGGI